MQDDDNKQTVTVSKLTFQSSPREPIYSSEKPLRGRWNSYPCFIDQLAKTQTGSSPTSYKTSPVENISFDVRLIWAPIPAT